MRFLARRGLTSILLVPAVLSPTTYAQQPASPTATSPQAIALLTQAAAALQGASPVADVTLSGSSHWIAGSDDETGTVVGKGLAGASRIDVNLPSGTREEIQNAASKPARGTWSGPDGVLHSIVFHNLLGEPVWFFPALAITRRLSATDYTASYIGQETYNNQSVDHISISEISPLPTPSGGVPFEHLTLINFFLDSATHLPAAMTFTVHPDNNSLFDIPVEIRFSDYRLVNGGQVPFHVQRFLNNSLILDLQFESVTLNTGLSINDFQ